MTTPYQTLILSDGPISYVPCNELSFPNHDLVTGAVDLGVGVVNPTYGNATIATLGSFADGFTTGVNCSIVFDNPFNVLGGTQTMTLEGWFQSTDTVGTGVGNEAPALLIGSSLAFPPASQNYTLGFSGAMKPTFGVVNGTTQDALTTSGNYNDGALHYVAATWDGVTGAAIIYVDGVAVASTTFTPLSTARGTTHWYCGSNQISGAGFIGTASNLAMYDYVLSPAQILSHYDAALNLTTTVPNVVGETQAQAEMDIVAALLTVGTVTSATDPIVPTGHVISQSLTAGSTQPQATPMDIVVSIGPASTVVPNIVGLSASTADAVILAAGLTIGPFTAAYGPQPIGIIVSQTIASGSIVAPGTALGGAIANGPQPFTMPNVVGLSQADALSDIQSIGVVVFDILSAYSNTVPAGTVLAQTPAPGTLVYPGTFATITVSKGPFVPPLTPVYDPNKTVISQYANSPTLLQLIANMAQYLRQDVNMQAFFNFVWNVETAQGFGLDRWGRIVDISRLLHIPNSAELFGFQNSTVPPGVVPFNIGVFNSKGGSATQTYLLPDDAYRILILAKALSNISATTAPAINQILRNLFPGRGNAFVEDLGGMAMQYTFQFVLTVVESAIIGQSNALPHGAGVAVSIVSD